MQFARFTKFWEQLSVTEIGERALELGFDALDLVVREGYAITPERVAEDLPSAVRHWQSIELACPMITADVHLTDPRAATTKALFAAAAKAGVPMIKLGYFTYTPGTDFDETWTAAKRALAGFESLSRSTGVQSLYHTHSGLCLGSNGAGLRHLLEHCDPNLVRAYIDPGHLAVNGEDIQLALPMVRDRLAAIAAKDAHHILDTSRARRSKYADAFVRVGEGAAQWEDLVRLLRSWAWNGVVSIHTEYTSDQTVISTVGGRDDTEAMLELRATGEREDLATLRRLWSGDDT